MSTQNINKVYPLAALFIHSCGMEVNKEKIQAIMKVLGLECSSKIAELFSKSKDQIESLINNANNIQVSVSNVDVKEDKKEEEKKEKVEEKVEEDEDIDFGDLFD